MLCTEQGGWLKPFTHGKLNYFLLAMSLYWSWQRICWWTFGNSTVLLYWVTCNSGSLSELHVIPQSVTCCWLNGFRIVMIISCKGLALAWCRGTLGTWYQNKLTLFSDFASAEWKLQLVATMQYEGGSDVTKHLPTTVSDFCASRTLFDTTGLDCTFLKWSAELWSGTSVVLMTQQSME